MKVAFTHPHDDHIHGAESFFYFDHAKKYQDGSRVKIGELWVPADFITGKDLPDEALPIRDEARYRLLEGYGIRVFSRPDALIDWLEKQDLTLEDRKKYIVDAGQNVPSFSFDYDELEVFVHSPFAFRQEENLEDRNSCSIVVQMTFLVKREATRVILSGDSTYERWIDIVNITKGHCREEKLAWDVFKLPHHCSYQSLGPEKGKDKTEPVEEVQEFHGMGQKRGIVISSSETIPAEDTDQPPHRQAANCYIELCEQIDGKFKVTMEHPLKNLLSLW